jgi:hypothetical protein
MVRNSTVFNKSAVARILSVATRTVQEVRIFAFSVWVWIKGQRPRFMSKSAFEREFVRFRREAGKLLQVLGSHQSAFGTEFQVEGSTSNYWVEVQETRTVCTCEDFHNHGQTCKHQYAVLHHLGIDSIEALVVRYRGSGRIKRDRYGVDRVNGRTI